MATFFKETLVKGLMLSMILIFLQIPACTSRDMTMQFHRTEKKIDGFTKHFDESLFKVTERGLFSVELLIKQEGMKVGRNDFALIIHDNKDRDVEDAVVNIVSRLQEQGIAVSPVIRNKGYGLYAVENLPISMPGHWELKIEVKKDSVEDSQFFYFPVLR